MVPLDTGTPGTSREISSEDAGADGVVDFSDKKSTTVEK